MATKVVCFSQLCSGIREVHCIEEKGGGKTTYGVVGREEKE